MILTLIKSSIATLILAFLLTGVQAQNDLPPLGFDFRYKFENLSTEQGLSQSTVKCFFQDRQGFLWIGTENGLNRYDGYHFKVFRNNPSDTATISHNSISCITQDKSGFLWIGTLGGGLSRYDPVNETFQNYQNNLADTSSLSSNYVYALLIDSVNNVWIGGSDNNKDYGCLNLLNRKTGTFSHYRVNIMDSHFHYTVKAINSLYLDRFGNLWSGTTASGIFVFDPITKKYIKHIFGEAVDKNLINGNSITAIQEDQSGIVWVTKKGYGGEGGLSRIEYDDQYNLVVKNSIPGATCTGLAIDEGMIWMTSPWGLTTYDTKKQVFKPIQTNILNPATVKEMDILTVYKDRNRVLWFGYKTYGIGKLVPERGFIHIKNEPSWTGGLINSDINILMESDSNTIWLSSRRGGFSKLDFKGDFHNTPKITNYRPGFNVQPMPYSAAISFLITGSKVLWLGTDGFCLNRFRWETDKHPEPFTPFDNAPQDKSLALDSWHIGVLYESKESGLWIGGEYGVYNVKNPYSAAPTFFKHIPINCQDIDIGSIISMGEPESGVLWVVTEKGQSYFLNTHSGKFYHNTMQLERSSTINKVLFENKSSILVGTSNGLLHYEMKNSGTQMSPHFLKRFEENNSLTNVDISSMEVDAAGNIWVSHQNGLSFLDRQTGKVINYNKEDGIQGNQFNRNSSCKLRNGYLFFGGTNGITLFHPDSLSRNSDSPTVVIAGFTADNEPVPVRKNNENDFTLSRSISYASEISVPYLVRIVSFEFASLDFTAPNKNQYAYMMEGFDGDWVYASKNRPAVYTNLNPGTYTLRVKGSNNDGVWSEAGATLTVNILPPPWKTWWAYALYGLGFVLLLVAARYEIIKRERLHHDFKLKKVEADKYHELDTMKSHFFANISHEFRTPLTLILGPLEKRLSVAAETTDKTELTLMHRNASRLLVLVNQLLDLSKLEAGQLKLNCQYADLRPAIQSISSQFSSMADSKGIHFQVRASEVALWFDPEKLKKIITNLLSNAFKFTSTGGNISLTLNQQPPNEKFKNGYAEIIVADTGVGIEPEHLPKIFDRFYQADTSSTRAYEGSGIGLALTKELVELHHGTIQVTSTPAQGSCFTVQLPLGSAHLKEGEIGYAPAKESQAVFSMDNYIEEVERENGLEQNSISKVLIVEDNEDLRFYLRTNLSDRYAIHEASDGEEGFALALEEVPDLIISDLMMPKIDGMQLCRQLKKDVRTSHIPVILLTAKVDQNTKIEGYETGADDYIAKPFNMIELNARIKGIIDNRKKLQEKYARQLNLKPKEINVESVDDRFLKRVLEIIELHIGDSSFSVDILATEAALSSVQLYRKLKALTNRTPNDLVRDMRLERAASLFKQHAGNVAEVAYQVGFNNLSYFAKCFKEKYNTTPSEFTKLA